MDVVSANVFLIGAQKAGTTFLAALLDQNHEVCVSDPKEPQFFTTHYEKGFEFYGRCFSDPAARIRLDASTTYTFLRPKGRRDIPDAPGLLAPAPERILAASPEARFIYILRDPVKRVASAHRHNMRTQKQPDGPVSLVKAMDDDPMLELASRYADQIEIYLDIVPKDRFLFLDFARLTRDTETVLAEVCDFIGVDVSTITLEQAERAKHGAHRVTGFGQRVMGGVRMVPGLERSLKAMVSPGLKDRLLDPLLKAPSDIVFNDEDEAKVRFADDRARVEALTGLKI